VRVVADVSGNLRFDGVVRIDGNVCVLEHCADRPRERVHGACLAVDGQVHGLVERGVRRSTAAEDGEH